MRKRAECISFVVDLSGADKQRNTTLLNSQVCFSAYVNILDFFFIIILKVRVVFFNLLLRNILLINFSPRKAFLES